MSILGALLLAATLAAADAAPRVDNPYLATAIEQLRDFEETKALASLEKAKTWRENTPHELALVHFYMGLAHAARVEREATLRSFKEALRIDPTLTCSPHLSPRVRGWWVEAGGKVEPPEAEAPPSSPPPAALPSEAAALPPPAPPPVLAPEAKAAPPPALALAVQERGAPARSRWPGWVVGGIGIVALGAGVALGLAAASDHSRALNEPDVGLSHQLQANAVRESQWANISYAVGAVGAAGGGVLIAFPLDFR